MLAGYAFVVRSHLGIPDGANVSTFFAGVSRDILPERIIFAALEHHFSKEENEYLFHSHWAAVEPTLTPDTLGRIREVLLKKDRIDLCSHNGFEEVDVAMDGIKIELFPALYWDGRIYQLTPFEVDANDY